MYDLIIRAARLSDEQVVDIAVQDGRITRNAIWRVATTSALAGSTPTFTAIPNPPSTMMKPMRQAWPTA